MIDFPVPGYDLSFDVGYERVFLGWCIYKRFRGSIVKSKRILESHVEGLM